MHNILIYVLISAILILLFLIILVIKYLRLLAAVLQKKCTEKSYKISREALTAEVNRYWEYFLVDLQNIFGAIPVVGDLQDY